jgi:hypothetical protein
MPKRALPPYIIDRESKIYRYTDDFGVAWWRCICSQACWDHCQYRDPRPLRRHQTAGGRHCCPVDPSFVPPIHKSTVEHVTQGVPGHVQVHVPQPGHHAVEHSPYALPHDPESAEEGHGDVQDDPAPFDPGVFSPSHLGSCGCVTCTCEQNEPYQVTYMYVSWSSLSSSNFYTVPV